LHRYWVAFFVQVKNRELLTLQTKNRDMKKIKFSESKILNILKEKEQGYTVAELCRKHGISEATYYNWKSKYAGMSVNELKRLKELEYENSRLKKMFADLSLEHEVVKDLLSKKF